MAERGITFHQHTYKSCQFSPYSDKQHLCFLPILPVLLPLDIHFLFLSYFQKNCYMHTCLHIITVVIIWFCSQLSWRCKRHLNTVLRNIHLWWMWQYWVNGLCDFKGLLQNKQFYNYKKIIAAVNSRS